MTLAKSRPGTASTADEVPFTLDQPAPRALSLLDQLGMWGNLGVSILGFTGAIFVLYPLTDGPPLGLGAALLALLVGTVLGTAAVAASAIPGVHTGQPSMVLLRGLFGARASWLPTVLNIVQLIGWTTFELYWISLAMHQVVDGVPRWIWVIAGGALTTLLALRPLGWIRTLRRYVSVVVLIALIWLGVQLLRNPLPALGSGSWHGFWLAVDSVIGVSVSYVPMASDYSRHSRSTRDAAGGIFFGYAVTQFICYAIGLVALVTVAQGDDGKIFGAFLAVPLGTLAFVVLTAREIDQSFVDTYSTAVSIQNIRPRWDRRVLAVVIGALSTVFAAVLTTDAYQNFLYLIGSVFVPLLGVFVVDWFVVSRQKWNLGASAPTRWLMVLPWAAGFVADQLVNPGYIDWWASFWTRLQPGIPPDWLSASILSFLVAAVVTLPVGSFERTLTGAHPSRGR